ncbi:MAG: hypothetical protein AB7P40_30930 [Chloroflexota bacterium]
MRKMLAAALMGLVVVGSTLSPVSAAEQANGDPYVDNEIVDGSALTNQISTLDDVQNSTSEQESPEPAPAPQPI